MKSSARTVVFPGAVSFGHTLAPLRRGLGDPCFLAPGDGSIWRTSLLPSGPVTARISRAGTNAVQCVAWGAGAASSSTCCPRCWAARTTPRTSCRGIRGSPPRSGASRTCGWAARAGAGSADPGDHRATGAGRGHVPLLAGAVGEVRHAGAGADEGPAVGAGVAQHPVVGVPPRQRRPAAGPDGGDLRAARRLAGTAGVAAGHAGVRGVDVAAGVGGGPPPRRRNGPSATRTPCRWATTTFPRWSAGRCWAVPSTTRACSNCWSRCGRIASGWSGCSKPAGWLVNPGGGRGFRSSKSTRFDSRRFRTLASGTRRPK